MISGAATGLRTADAWLRTANSEQRTAQMKRIPRITSS
jgi:hypothetical protein